MNNFSCNFTQEGEHEHFCKGDFRTITLRSLLAQGLALVLLFYLFWTNSCFDFQSSSLQTKSATFMILTISFLPFLKPPLIFSSFPLFFPSTSRQPSKASPLSTRSPASRRPRVWTASTRGCRRGGTRCPRTPASTRSTGPCPRRPTARTPRGAPAPAAEAASSEGQQQQAPPRPAGLPGPQPHHGPPLHRRRRRVKGRRRRNVGGAAVWMGEAAVAETWGGHLTCSSLLKCLHNISS